MRKRGFMSGSPPPILAAMVISLPSLEKIFPRLASIAPLKCLDLRPFAVSGHVQPVDG